MREIIVTYITLEDNVSHNAVFDSLADAMLWWDTIWYLRNEYKTTCARPS